MQHRLHRIPYSRASASHLLVFCSPLPKIVVYSLLHQFHVLIVTKCGLISWTRYLDSIAKGYQGVCMWDILGIWKLQSRKPWEPS